MAVMERTAGGVVSEDREPLERTCSNSFPPAVDVRSR
jgi:hypothetical protein